MILDTNALIKFDTSFKIENIDFETKVEARFPNNYYFIFLMNGLADVGSLSILVSLKPGFRWLSHGLSGKPYPQEAGYLML